MGEDEKELEVIVSGQVALAKLLVANQNPEIEEKDFIKGMVKKFTTFYTGTAQQIKEKVNEGFYGSLNKFLYDFLFCGEGLLCGATTGYAYATKGEFEYLAIAIPAFVDLASRVHYHLKNRTSLSESPNLIGQIKESNLVGKVKEYMRPRSK